MRTQKSAIMNKFKFYFIVLITTFSLFSCSKDDTPAEITPPRDYTAQYNTEIADIETYLKANYIKVLDHEGYQDDQDVTIIKIPVGGNQSSIYSFLNSDSFPKLLSRDISLHNITYKLYYLVLREGKKDDVSGFGGESPSNVDAVFSSYKGNLLDGTVFDFSNNGQSQYNLDGVNHDGGIGVIRGWSEAFPKFKTGWLSSNTDGSIGYHDFGTGLMFLPSGLAYYDIPKDKVPEYSPLVFSIKLFSLKRFDHDNDGIPSFKEDIYNDDYMYDYRNLFNYPTFPEDKIRYADDTDRDGIPNFLDVDDDGDNYTTRLELKKPDGTYHTFETVPSCSGQTEKRYLTANCKPPYTQ